MNILSAQTLFVSKVHRKRGCSFNPCSMYFSWGSFPSL